MHVFINTEHILIVITSGQLVTKIFCLFQVTEPNIGRRRFKVESGMNCDSTADNTRQALLSTIYKNSSLSILKATVVAEITRKNAGPAGQCLRTVRLEKKKSKIGFVNLFPELLSYCKGN